MRITILYSLCCLLFAACSSPVDPNIPAYEPQVVVNSLFSPDSLWQVHLSRSRSILDPGPFPTIPDAYVEIQDAGNIVATLQPIGYGKDLMYESSINVPSVDRLYSIRVAIPGSKDTLVSFNLAPEKVDFVHQVVYINEALNDSNQYMLNGRFMIQFEDAPGEANYYHLRAFFNYKASPPGTNFKREQIRLASDDLSASPGPGTGILLDDELYDGTTKTVFVDFNQVLCGYPCGEVLDFAELEFRSVSRDYFLHHQTLAKQRENFNDPFSEPILLYENIQNGKGIFAGYTPTWDTIPFRP